VNGVEAYSLIGRDDLALLARETEVAAEGEPTSTASGGRHAKDLLEAAAGLPGAPDELLTPSPSADPLESSEWLYRMFDRDRRAK